MKFIQGEAITKKEILSMVNFKYFDGKYYSILISKRNMDAFSDEDHQIIKNLHLFDLNSEFVLSFNTVIYFQYLKKLYFIRGFTQYNNNYLIGQVEWNFKMNRMNNKILKL